MDNPEKPATLCKQDAGKHNKT